jgi:uncharacterized protein YecE (DUF72 family)
MRSPIIVYEPPRRARTDFRIGLSAWTDTSLLEEGTFYPRKTMTAEERLWWYSRFFDAVEVNSTFYAIPSVDTVMSWTDRTPPGFIFNLKAFGLLTGHDVDAARLPDALRAMLPAGASTRHGGRIANSALGDAARTRACDELRRALEPLRRADKLGYVLFQLAPWVKFGDDTLTYLAGLPRRLPGCVIAVEFRHRSWFGAHLDETLRFLREQSLTYVSIDGPRSRATVPSVPALTSPTAVFRLHGRNFEGHLKQLQGRRPSVSEKYDYLYSEKELEEIARTAAAMNGKAERVHLAMNNNNRDYPVVNGLQLKEMLLEDWHPPDRAALTEEFEERRASRPHRTRSAHRTSRKHRVVG